MIRQCSGIVLTLISVLFAHTVRAETAEPLQGTTPPPTIAWRSNYRAALEEAKTGKAMVLLWFLDPRQDDENELLEQALFRQEAVAAQLARFVPVKLPLAAPSATSSDERRLLNHPAFQELLGQPGLALIDMRDEESPHFHHVVSVFPFSHEPMTAAQLIALLDLPAGSLTQRTLIWAVRTHPDSPASAAAEASPLLLGEAASHSGYQARICRQGHHQWDQRFQRINAQLPAGLVAQEVCAESWPNQHLVEAAQECVHSWRQSSGHWEAVRAGHPLFGYDMKRGPSGIWFATGIFGRRR